VRFAAGDLWTTDRADGVVVDGVPAGATYRIDPATGEVLATIPGTVGGCGAVGLGALWLCTLAGDLDVVTRIDMGTNKVRQITDGLGPGTEPEAIALADDAVWIGSNSRGTIRRYDPRTLRSTASLQVTPAGPGGLRGAVAVAGTSAWFGIADAWEIVRVDLGRVRVAGRTSLPTGPVDGVFLDGSTLYAWTPGHLYELDADGPAGPVLRRTLELPSGDTLSWLRSIDGSLWAGSPTSPRLVRIDPTRFAISGVAMLRDPEPNDDALRLSMDGGSVWGRKDGELVELRLP
jgi:streptogramin lyase